MKRKLISFLIILILAISALGLGLVLYDNSKTVKVPDFSNQTLSDVEKWCTALKDKACVIDYEYSETVLEGNVIYQSIKADEKLEDSISFIISKGKEPSIQLLSITNETTREDVEKWLVTTKITSVVFENVYSDTVEEGKVIQIVSNTEIVNEDSSLTVYISKGKQDEVKINENGVEIEGGTYVGLTLEKFKSKVEDLKLVASHREEWDDYSSSIEKGSIIKHGSGTYEENEKISYGLSLGKKDGSDIEITKGTYIGYSEDNFKTKAQELGLKANHQTSRDDYSDTVEKGAIVWHGSGSYVKYETFNYGLSLGKITETDDLEITKTEYLGLTEDQFKSKANDLGLKANHQTSRDAYSDTIAKGSIVWHGSGSYVKGETFNYGLSLGKKDSNPKTVTISEMKYVGLTEDEFKSKANELGLKPNHKTSLDDYSNTITKGSIVWHGTGTYDVNDPSDTFNYGLSLGSKSSGRVESITIEKGKYVGLTVSQFEAKMKELGFLSIEKTSAYEDYSNVVPAGNVIWHGSGTYTASETSIRYSISKGSKTPESIDNDPTQEKVTVASNAYVGKTVNEFITFCTNNGLVAKYSSNYDDFSSSVTSGNIIKHDSGSISKGSTVYYGLSKGVKTASLLSTTEINNVWVGSPVSVATTKNILSTKLQEKGFTNVTYSEVKSVNDSVGVVLSVKVNGNEHTSAQTYPVNAAIVITICNSN